MSLSESTVWERFAAMVRRMPDAPAILSGGHGTSYAQLHAMAAALAARLPETGNGEAGTVAILAQDTVQAIAAMLGAARRGHAYVPLDGNDPEERLRFILRDCAPLALLADAAQLAPARALAPEGVPVLALDDMLHGPADTASPATPDSLLYLCYTSGSTGQPKGVRQTQRNLLFFVDAYASTLDIRPADRLSLLYTLSFSASNMDIYGALLHGATLCPYDTRRRGIPELADWLDGMAVTVLHAVPTVFRELTQMLPEGRRLAHVRAVDLGGESVFAEDIVRFRRHAASGCRIVNHLAATEASVIAQYVVDEQAGASGPLPVGRSPQGLEVRILRDDGSEAEADESGHIAIDSPYLSPGYWRRPELDAAAFADLPGRPGWRRYRSGDLGRKDAAGNLHFIGRAGSRIKLRGMSVDLNEVEAALLGCSGVAAAAVLAPAESGKEAERLLACLVMAPGVPAEPLRLRRQLRARLPEYMLPGGYVFLDNLPATATGKVDRRALAAMDLEQRQYRPDYEAPADDAERAVAQIFSQVLDYAPVGRRDDFFLLGGDSMSLVGLQLQLRKAFGRDATELYLDATVAGLAARMRADTPDARQGMARLVPLRTQGAAPALFLVHGRRGQAYVSPHFIRLLGDDQPLYALQARGLDGREAPHATIEDMAADYVAAVRRRQPQGPYLIGALCAGGYVAMAMARMLRAAGEEVLPLLLLDLPLPPFRGSGRLDQAKLARGLQARREQGRIAVPGDGEHYTQAAFAVACAFEDALARHRPAVYDAPAFLLANRKRLAPRKWGNPAKLRGIFGGPLECHLVADRHAEMLDPHNPVFAERLTHCLRKIRGGEALTDTMAQQENAIAQRTAGGSGWWRSVRRLCRL